MDYVLLEGRSEIAVRTQALIQETLDDYGTGITVSKVNLQDTNFPSQVEAAVQDAIKAREDKERLAFEAQSYSNDILPRARGEGVRRNQDSEAYKARVIADAEGEASRFKQLLKEYEKAPGVTRDRLYLEAIETVYANSSKVFLDAAGSGNMIYLPIDKLLEKRSETNDGSAGGSAGSPPSTQPETPRRQTEDLRIRRNR
jgi:membrane protease subunit HflK